MEALRILIVEDELIIARDIKDIVEALGHEVVGIAANALDALDILQHEHVQLVLLDIFIKGERDGVWVAQQISSNHQLPFVYLTSYSDSETLARAKQTQPYGYLLKPFEDEDVRVAIEIAYANFQSMAAQQKQSEEILEDSIFVKEKNLFKKIPFDQILFVQADSNYVTVQTNERSYTLRNTLSEFQDKLPKAKFERIHRSYIVNLAHVDAINSTYVKIGSEELPMSREVQATLIKRINKL